MPRSRAAIAIGLATGLAACGSAGDQVDAHRIDGAAADAPTPDATPDAAPRQLTAPGQMAITCPGDIPVDGKIDCTTTITWPEGDIAYQGGVGVGLHGRSSLGFPKHQYAIELRHPDGSDDDVDLFGMGADADWLLGGMYIDRALMRNKLAYDLFRAMGDVAPDSRYVELTLGGVAQGVYLLTERIEHGVERVDIPADDGTGSSFIVRASETGIPSMVQYGSWEAVYPPDPQPAGVAARISAFETSIVDGTDAMFDEVDLDELVDFVLLEEVLKNNDAYYLSHNLYTMPGGALGFIPWDLDLTLGQPSYNNNELSDQWIAYRPELIASPAMRPMFQDRLAARWAELRAGVFATDAVIARIEANRAFLGDAIARNWEVWDISAVPNAGFPLYAVTSADDEYTHVEAFITARLAWVDANVGAY